MLTWIREKFGAVIISIIIGFISFVFVFYGVFSPKATRGLHDSAVAGTVNGDPITLIEFREELGRRMNFFKQLGGGQLTEEQLEAFHLKKMVFQELAKKKVMLQEASRMGLEPSDEQVKETISDLPYFKKNGKFDFTTYKQILQANNLTPNGFEQKIREDITVRQFDSYFRSRIKVTDQEAKDQFIANNDKREAKYVQLTMDSGKKGLTIAPAEIEAFLKDTGKLNIAKSRFNAYKNMAYKGKEFDAVKKEIARDILAGDKLAEVQKINQKLAGQILGLLKADQSSDAKINALLKPYGVTVKQSGFFAASESRIAGIGDASEMVRDAFAFKSPIDPAQGGKAKKYDQAGGVVIAILTGAQHPDLAKFDTEREQMVRTVSYKKERLLYDEWLRNLMSKAKIDMNPSVVGETKESEG